MQGPPAAGKTYYGAQLAKHYNIPLITIESVIEMSKGIEGEFADEIREALESERNQMQEKEQERLDQQKEKAEKMGKVIVEEVVFPPVF